MVSEEMTVRDMTGVREMTVEMTCTVPRAKAQLRQLMSEMSKSGTLKMFSCFNDIVCKQFDYMNVF